MQCGFDVESLSEVTERNVVSGGPEPLDEGDSAAGIMEIFRKMLAGLRHLRRPERMQALRAAREWLQYAMSGVREKRARERQGQLMARRLRLLPRSPQ